MKYFFLILISLSSFAQDEESTDSLDWLKIKEGTYLLLINKYANPDYSEQDKKCLFVLLDYLIRIKTKTGLNTDILLGDKTGPYKKTLLDDGKAYKNILLQELDLATNKKIKTVINSLIYLIDKDDLQRRQIYRKYATQKELSHIYLNYETRLELSGLRPKEDLLKQLNDIYIENYDFENDRLIRLLNKINESILATGVQIIVDSLPHVKQVKNSLRDTGVNYITSSNIPVDNSKEITFSKISIRDLIKFIEMYYDVYIYAKENNLVITSDLKQSYKEDFPFYWHGSSLYNLMHSPYFATAEVEQEYLQFKDQIINISYQRGFFRLLLKSGLYFDISIIHQNVIEDLQEICDKNKERKSQKYEKNLQIVARMIISSDSKYSDFDQIFIPSFGVFLEAH